MLSLIHILEWRARVTPDTLALSDHLGAELSLAAATCTCSAGSTRLASSTSWRQGTAPNMRRGFDPDRYKIVLFDQRGCGRSTPHASDPAADMSRNTTSHLLADMERLRQYLAIDRWLLSGGSWGCTLALAYAERYPERVSQIVLLAITTSRRSETEWLYRGVSRFFPEAYEKFRAGAPEAGRDGDLLAAYARRMESPDFQVRVEAAQAWCDWEDAVLSRERRQSLSPYSASQQARTEQWAFVRICANYATHGAAAPLLSL